MKILYREFPYCQLETQSDVFKCRIRFGYSDVANNHAPLVHAGELPQVRDNHQGWQVSCSRMNPDGKDHRFRSCQSHVRVLIVGPLSALQVVGYWFWVGQIAPLSVSAGNVVDRVFIVFIICFEAYLPTARTWVGLS